jgi:hypothetical protein
MLYGKIIISLLIGVGLFFLGYNKASQPPKDITIKELSLELDKEVNFYLNIDSNNQLYFKKLQGNTWKIKKIKPKRRNNELS